MIRSKDWGRTVDAAAAALGTTPERGRSPLRVVAVDDHPVVLSGLRLLAESDEHLEFVALTSTGAEAVAACGRLRPDILLLDLRLPDMAAATVCARAREAHPSLRVIVLTAHPEDMILRGCFRAGACGCLLKDASGRSLVQALEKTIRGNAVIDPRVAGAMVVRGAAGRPAAGALSDREGEVLSLIARGLTTREIGEQLHLSSNTVKSHVRSLFGKFGVHNRVQLIARATQDHPPAGGAERR